MLGPRMLLLSFISRSNALHLPRSLICSPELAHRNPNPPRVTDNKHQHLNTHTKHPCLPVSRPVFFSASSRPFFFFFFLLPIGLLNQKDRRTTVVVVVLSQSVGLVKRIGAARSVRQRRLKQQLGDGRLVGQGRAHWSLALLRPHHDQHLSSVVVAWLLVFAASKSVQFYLCFRGFFWFVGSKGSLDWPKGQSR